MYVGCYDLNHACVSPLRLEEVIRSCSTTTAYEAVHFCTSPKGHNLSAFSRIQHICVYIYIAIYWIYCVQFGLYMLEQLYNIQLIQHSPWFMCQLASTAQAANLLITSAENGDLRKVRRDVVTWCHKTSWLNRPHVFTGWKRLLKKYIQDVLLLYLDGVFKYFVFVIFTPKLGEMIQFDSCFSNGLVQPPTRYVLAHLDPFWVIQFSRHKSRLIWLSKPACCTKVLSDLCVLHI